VLLNLEYENLTYFAKSMAPFGSSAAAMVSFERRVSMGEGGEEGLKWGREQTACSMKIDVLLHPSAHYTEIDRYVARNIDGHKKMASL